MKPQHLLLFLTTSITVACSGGSSGSDKVVPFDESKYEVPEACGATHPMVGLSGEFSTLSHGVSGKSEIIDDCNIEITEFNYDGGGPAVYFYGALESDFEDESAFAIGMLLTGTSFTNNTLTIALPDNKTMDDLDSLSVWCEDFSVSFGDLVFE